MSRSAIDSIPARFLPECGASRPPNI